MNIVKYMKNFLNILKKQGYQKKLGKYIPIFNYYKNIKGAELDKKYLFLTNNITENINKILNNNFKGRYPNFIDWKNSLLSTIKRFENIDKELNRLNVTSEMLIYFINIKKNNNKKLTLLDEAEIKDLMKIYDKNDNDLSSQSISSILKLNLHEDNNNNLLNSHIDN